MALERTVVELEGRANVLEKEAVELRRENGWLKEMIVLKGRNMRVAREATAALSASKPEAEEDEEEEEEENEAGPSRRDDEKDGSK